MKKFRGIVLLWVVAAVVTLAVFPCPASENKEDGKDIITTEDEQMGQRERGRLELTGEEYNRLLEVIKKSNPQKAKEIARLQKKDPDKFKAELRTNARDEYDKIIKGRLENYIERRMQERRADFIEWLKKNVPDVASELDRLKERDPDLYAKKYDWADEKYGRVFRESRDHPEETKILLEDLKLRDREDSLVAKIKRSNDDKDKKKLIDQLERVLSDRYDLIVIRKQNAYERLLRWLERLQNRIEESKAQIEEAKKKEIKDKNIKDRVETLLKGKKRGILDD